MTAVADINHPAALLEAWQGEADYLGELLAVTGRWDASDRPADIPTAVLYARRNCLEELRGQLLRRLEWSGMLEP